MRNQLDLTKENNVNNLYSEKNNEDPIDFLTLKDISNFIIGLIFKNCQNCQPLIYLLNSSSNFRRFSQNKYY